MADPFGALENEVATATPVIPRSMTARRSAAIPASSISAWNTRWIHSLAELVLIPAEPALHVTLGPTWRI